MVSTEDKDAANLGPSPGTVALVVCAGGASAFAASESSNAPSLLAFTGALLVALITWYATDRRQTAALMADDRRHRASLDAEQTRLALTLRHERDLNDRQRLRDFLDDAAAVLEDVTTTFLTLSVALDEDVDELGNGGDECGTESDSDRLEEPQLEQLQLRSEGRSKNLELGAWARKMALRFPSDDRILTAFREAEEALTDGLDAAAEAHPADVRSRNVSEAGKRLMRAFGDYSTAVRDHFDREPSTPDVR